MNINKIIMACLAFVLTALTAVGETPPTKFRWDNVDGQSYLTPVKCQNTADDRSYAYALADCLEAQRLINLKTPYTSLKKEDRAAAISPYVEIAADAYLRDGDMDRAWGGTGWPCVLKSMDWMLRTGINGCRVTNVIMLEPNCYEPDTLGWWWYVEYLQQMISSFGPIVAQYQHVDRHLYNGKYYRIPEESVATIEPLESLECARSVAIVGYDDSVPASLFVPPGAVVTFGDGAWIAKCSNGTGFGENGYFYISYYDSSLFGADGFGLSDHGYTSYYAYAFGLDSNQLLGAVYGPELNCPSTAEDRGYHSYACVFTAEKDCEIGAFGVMSFGGEDCKVSAFVGCAEGNPVSGTQIFDRQEYYIYDVGYHAIQLKTPFAVKKGQRFSIVVDRLLVHGLMNLSNPVHGQCFRGTILHDKDPVTQYEWVDMADGVETYDYANACYVTAYTIAEKKDTLVVKGEPIDGDRLLAHSTLGSDWFWRDVESVLGISSNAFTATVGATPVADESVPTRRVGIAAESGVYSFEIEASDAWTVSCESPWVRLSKSGGLKGTSTLTVTVDANTDGKIRRGDLNFACGGEHRTFTVVQDVLPKVLDWKVFGKDTHVEEDKDGKVLEDPCLVAGSNCVLRLEFCHFNFKRYTFSSIKVKGEPTDSPALNEIPVDWHQTVRANDSCVIEIDSERPLAKGHGYHGPYDFSVEIECDQIGKVEVLEAKSKLAKKVFFDKYEKDNGREPNWFVYWSEDGAVPALSLGGQCRYSDVEGGVLISHIRELDKDLRIGQNDEWGGADADTGRVTLHKRAPDGHYYYYKQSLKAGGIEFSIPWEYGIYTVANVMAHELQHIVTYQTYVSDLAGRGITFVPNKEVEGLEDYDSDAENQWEHLDEATCVLKLDPSVCKGNVGMDRFYNDNLTDEREAKINESLGVAWGFELDDGKVDTFNLGQKKPGGNYELSGDNEFMSMLAGYLANKDLKIVDNATSIDTESSMTAIEENDWAYPGHQSYLPEFKGKVVPRRTNGDTANAKIGIGVFAKKELAQDSERTDESFVASNGVVAAINADAVACGMDDDIRYRLSFDVSGTETIRFVGYLIDPASNVVACAGANADLSESNNSCELSFSIRDISSSGFIGPYTLAGMIVYRVDDMDYSCVGIFRDIVTDWVTVKPMNCTEGRVGLSDPNLTVSEGDELALVVSGGNAVKASSVQVYQTYQTASAADVDLSKGMVDGVIPKGGLKFPLTLSWAKGEVTNRVIRIPVKTDKMVEDDENLVFQLAAAQGQELGETMVCKVTIRDGNEMASLQDGAMNPNIKISSKATKDGAAWHVGRGNEEDPDGSLGLYHAETPALSVGASSELTTGTVKAGALYFKMRFAGPVEEETPSTLSVYVDKTLVGVIGHGTEDRDGWVFSVTNTWSPVKLAIKGKGGAVRLVFKQGSDTAVHAEVSKFGWDDGYGTTDYDLRVLSQNSEGGYVTGSGLYAKNANATIKAVAKPGWQFDGWYANDENTNRFLWGEKASTSVRVISDFRVYAQFSHIPYVAGLASPVDGGKVTGSGYCAAGKKVTLKATANKNFTFVGWYAAESDGQGLTALPVTTVPSLVFDRSAKTAKSDAKQFVITNMSESVTYYAVFKSDPTIYVYLASDDNATAPGKVTGAGKYAAGKTKIALKATANKGYVFRGWYEGASVDLINDVPLTKSATYTLAEMPTNDVEYTAGFITSDLDKANITAMVDSFGFDAAHLSYATNIWTGVYLEWPVAASALSETTVKVSGLPNGLKFTAKDVTQKIGSGKTAQTVVVVPANTIYGAPSAASKVDKSGKATPSQVKVTVTTAGKSSQTYRIDTTVDPLPDWAVGTFTGPSYGGEATNGAVTVTIAASGKISAKQPVDGKSVSFAANYFDWYDADADAFWATLTAKSGTTVLTNEMVVSGHAGCVTLPAVGGGTPTLPDGGVVINGVIEAERFDAWQYNWKAEPWKTLGKSFDKKTVTYYIAVDGSIADEDDEEGMIALGGGLGEAALPLDGVNVKGKVTLKFAASGAVTVSGEFVQFGQDGQPVYKNKKLQTVKATGSATMVPVADEAGETCYNVFIYLAPKGLPAHARCVEVE